MVKFPAQQHNNIIYPMYVYPMKASIIENSCLYILVNVYVLKFTLNIMPYACVG